MTRRLLALLLAGVLGGAGLSAWASARWQRVEVVSASMVPTLQPGDRAWVDTSWKGAAGIAAGDVVVFRDPGGFSDAAGTLVTKRVLATGGQTLICCDRAGALLREGRPVPEPYLAPGTPPSTLAFAVTVPDGQLWVMGDNRSHSLDSRQLHIGTASGLVPLEAVVGRVVGSP